MPQFSPADWHEINWVCETAQQPYTLNFHRYEDWYRWNQNLKSMEEESRKISTVRKGLGWTQEGHMKRIGSMPLHLFNFLKKMNPNFATNNPGGREMYYKFIQHRPEFSVK